MKKCILLLLIIVCFQVKSQVNVGDTIKIKTFKYGSTTRDTLINFPTGNQTYEKIIMKYNMRCKNNLVSTQAAPNQGCGEWDYSCNTFIVDSSKIELNPKTQANPIISNFTGSVFPYVSYPLADYYDYMNTNNNITSVTSETLFPISAGTTTNLTLLKANERSGRSQLLITATELANAGLTAGPINGFFLNVANTGGTVNFFKVKMRLVSATVNQLSLATPTLSGFTQVFNNNYTFVNGNNRIFFNTPFSWDGTSNVLVDLSFTNTQPSTPIVLNGITTASNTVLFANNNYAIDLANNGHVTINPTNLNTINTELTVTFWAFGSAALLPTSTFFIYGWSNNVNQRHLSIHLPWSDNTVYYDAGHSAGSFDRINKLSVASETEGQWNHWAFTKNTVTGSMKIYLNGTLWHSGTSKTKPLSILNLILGKNGLLEDNYKGSVNELSIWNKELAATEIQNYMNREIPNTHPNYTNLVAYYKFNEGSGSTVSDSKFPVTSLGTGTAWKYDRGDQLTRNFAESTNRPNINFFKGTYVTTTNTLIVRDSVVRAANSISNYSITNNSTVVPMAHDAVVLTSTSYSYQALAKNIYNGDNNNALTGTIAVIPTGTLIIGSLPYLERYPFYNEIMSFVTPYGKGLSLGVNGKSWFYDVTDFTPLLKGPKRMLMSQGGEFQEQMDIDFYFIIGTPPRNVLQFNQLWQGAPRLGGAPILSINSGAIFPALNVPLLANGQAFKVRSTLTGHGAQGEFHQNGGTVLHNINVNGGPAEFTWNITQDCSKNPVYPQGGTWIYDRQGWCPGEASLLKEHNITPFVTPGTTVNIDYGCSNPPNPSGQYDYLAAHQLITYGGPNFSTDASILDVLHPSEKVLYSRTNPICSSPKILVQNTGSVTLTSIALEYWINNATTKQTFTWTGSLAFLDTVTISLPIATLWQNGLLNTGNVFYAEIKTTNGAADSYPYNNKYTSRFTKPDIISDYFYIEVQTNNNYTTNDYKLYDDQGTLVGSSTFTANNTVFKDYYTLTGCYKLVFNDYGKDGLTWWANAGQGSGYLRVRDGYNNNFLKTFNSDFGSFIEYNFTASSPVSLKEQALKVNFYVSPNPSKDKFYINGLRTNNATIYITDVFGKKIAELTNGLNTEVVFDASELAKGVYFVTVTAEGKSTTKKILVN